MRVKVGTEVLEKDSLKSHLGATSREKRDNLCDRVMRGHITRYQRNAEIKGYDWQNKAWNGNLDLCRGSMFDKMVVWFVWLWSVLLFRLEWESAILRGCSSFRRMEDDRLNQLRYLAEQYQQILDEHRPKLVSNAHRLDEPIRRIHVSRDMEVVRKKVISILLIPTFKIILYNF